uniref:Corrinoid adenosyltransferase MMAB n=2 Tax=Lotharella oceanica TaxID=641309 RepID=A0A7S2X672_9EUKA|mmetsp:Transcript_11361/g.21808  ORF Transcript_11361/g.21808 Transcript_11361/m.21808 type:complete len:148 (+) Transcript_11361:109-552(+)
MAMLSVIQSRLLDAGSHIATPRLSSTPERLKLVEFSEAHVDQLEAWIDQMDEDLPELKNFILPGGGHAGSALHVARSVARRTERSIIHLVSQGEVDSAVLKYMNRLSDFFFVAARYASMRTGNEEVVYKKADADAVGRTAVPRSASA